MQLRLGEALAKYLPQVPAITVLHHDTQLRVLAKERLAVGDDMVMRKVLEQLNLLQRQGLIVFAEAFQKNGLCDMQTAIGILNLGDLYTESGQTLQGSFSAVSKPNFARLSKYSLE